MVNLVSLRGGGFVKQKCFRKGALRLLNTAILVASYRFDI